MQRRRVFPLLASAALAAATALRASSAGDPSQCSQSHVDWVTKVLERMQTIKPGSTRKALLTVFTTEGGLSTGLRRTFVSQDCPYFKVDVEFEPAAGRKFDKEGRLTNKADDHDVIVKISRPYLEFTMAD